MVYDYEEMSEIPDLAKFTDDLVEEVLVSAFFQQKSDKENLPKLKLVYSNAGNYTHGL